MFKCQNCNKEFKTQNALNAHNGKCCFNKKYHFIYKTTNLINNKYYIGMHSTNVIDDGYLGSGTRLTRAIRKYGKENFRREILEYLPNRNELALRESEIVTSDIVLDELCMNLKPGGFGGLCNEEHRQKFINSSSHEIYKYKLQNDIEFRKYISDIHSKIFKSLWQNENYKQNQLINNPFCNGQLWQGRLHTEETKQKIRDKNKLTQKGEKNSSYGTCWIMKDNVSKKIKKEELDSYIEEGWIQGRKCNSSESLKKYRKNNKLICINKDNINKYIKLEELDKYLSDGYKRGQIKNLDYYKNNELIWIYKDNISKRININLLSDYLYNME